MEKIGWSLEVDPIEIAEFSRATASPSHASRHSAPRSTGATKERCCRGHVHARAGTESCDAPDRKASQRQPDKQLPSGSGQSGEPVVELVAQCAAKIGREAEKAQERH